MTLTELRQNIDESGTYTSDDDIFEFLYPYAVQNTENPDYSGTAVKSKFPVIYSNTVTLSYDATGGLHSTTTYRLARMLINGKTVAVISAHIPVGSSDDHVETRAYFISALIGVVAYDDYAIVAGDFNLAGNGSNVSSLDELANTRTYLHSVGWEACNGAYLAPEATTSKSTYIDNIFYKNNGKIIYDNFHSLSEMYSSLSSDHYPVYADLVLI